MGYFNEEKFWFKLRIRGESENWEFSEMFIVFSGVRAREGLNLFRFQMHQSTELNLCSIMLNTHSESLHCWRQKRRSLSRPSKDREQKLWLVHDYLW